MLLLVLGIFLGSDKGIGVFLSFLWLRSLLFLGGFSEFSTLMNSKRASVLNSSGLFKPTRLLLLMAYLLGSFETDVTDLPQSQRHRSSPKYNFIYNSV